MVFTVCFPFRVIPTSRLRFEGSAPRPPPSRAMVLHPGPSGTQGPTYWTVEGCRLAFYLSRGFLTVFAGVRSASPTGDLSPGPVGLDGEVRGREGPHRCDPLLLFAGRRYELDRLERSTKRKNIKKGKAECMSPRQTSFCFPRGVPRVTWSLVHTACASCRALRNLFMACREFFFFCAWTR